MKKSDIRGKLFLLREIEKKLDGSEYKVFIALCRYSKDLDYVSVPVSQLVKETGCSRNTVKRKLESLCRKQVIRKLDFVQAEKARMNGKVPVLRSETQPLYIKKPNVYRLIAIKSLGLPEDIKQKFKPISTGKSFGYVEGFYYGFGIKELEGLKEYRSTTNFLDFSSMYELFENEKLSRLTLGELYRLEELLASLFFNKNENQALVEDCFSLWDFIQNGLEKNTVLLVNEAGRTDSEQKTYEAEQKLKAEEREKADAITLAEWEKSKEGKKRIKMWNMKKAETSKTEKITEVETEKIHQITEVE